MLKKINLNLKIIELDNKISGIYELKEIDKFVPETKKIIDDEYLNNLLAEKGIHRGKICKCNKLSRFQPDRW